MDWLTIKAATLTLPGFAVTCGLCRRIMCRLTLGEAQAAAVAHLEEKHGQAPKRRIWTGLTEADTKAGD